MEERQARDRLGRHRQPFRRDQLGSGNDDQLLARQKLMMQARPVRHAISQSDVYPAGKEVDDIVVGIEEDRDASVLGSECREIGNQPFGRQRGRQRDRDRAGVLIAADIANRIAEHGKGPTRHRMQPLAFARLLDAVRPAIEQGNAEVGFEKLDLPADRAMGHPKLVGRSAQVRLRGGNVEGLQGAQMPEGPAHYYQFFSQ